MSSMDGFSFFYFLLTFVSLKKKKKVSSFGTIIFTCLWYSSLQADIFFLGAKLFGSGPIRVAHATLCAAQHGHTSGELSFSSSTFHLLCIYSYSALSNNSVPLASCHASWKDDQKKQKTVQDETTNVMFHTFALVVALVIPIQDVAVDSQNWHAFHVHVLF